MQRKLNLSEKEQEIITLYIVKGCIKFAEESNQEFEDVLYEEIFANQASQPYSQMICRNLEILKTKGYIDGIVEIEYEPIEDLQTKEETTTNIIALEFSTFENISITTRGKIEMQLDQMKDGTKQFIDKALPIIKYVGSEVLSATIQSVFIYAVNSAGIPL